MSTSAMMPDVDDELRRQQRLALGIGDPRALLGWLHARARTTADVQSPRAGDRVGGELLAAVLRAALAGRREVDVLRRGGIEERRVGKLIDGFRALVRGQPRPWSTVRAWASALDLDFLDLAVVVEVQVVRPSAPPLPVRPHPLTMLPNGPCCGRCVSRIWAVGAGAGVRCGNPKSVVGLGGVIPGLAESCPAYRGRDGGPLPV